MRQMWQSTNAFAVVQMTCDDYCLSLKYALKLSFHIKCPGKVSGHAGKNAHDMFFLPKSCTSSYLIIFCFHFVVT